MLFRSGRALAFSALLVTGIAAGCAEDATGPSEIDPGTSLTAGVARQGLLRCTPRPYASARALIGPLGGTIKVGGNEFKVPRGSLLLPTVITMELPSDTVKSVRFSPEGLAFRYTALPELKLDYKNCALPKGYKPKVVYTTETLRVIETLPSVSDSAAGSVAARLKHFSRYAITY